MTTALEAVDPDLVDMMQAVFADQRADHPTTGPVTHDAELWRQLDGLGLVRLTGPENGGGSGAGWPEAAALLSAAVRNGVRTAVAEHDLLACWLLDTVGVGVDDQVRTVCLTDESGVGRGVPWASQAGRIVVVWRAGAQHFAADVEPAQLKITAGVNAIGEPRDTVVADLAGLHGVPLQDDVVAILQRKCALLRAIQVCAALDAALESSVAHVSSRVQFGRALAKFQSIQALIADIAAEAAVARAATEAALTAAIDTDWSGARLDFLVAVARSCVGHAASVVARNAHQVHGAIGTTQEHRLHEFTRAALAWRSEFGSVRYWDDQVTSAVVQAGPSRLWELITG